MLEKILDKVNSTSNSTRQICINTGIGSLVVYTVPVGKTFIGYLTGNGGNGSIAINGAWLSSNAAPLPLTLTGGTVVKNNNNSYTSTIVGIEQ